MSVALWVPAVCVSSAWFNYNNKGLWALIMAQVGLATYAGDQVCIILCKLSGPSDINNTLDRQFSIANRWDSVGSSS